ncbi:hypothetical protein GCM10023067_33490 [Aminobacter aganoensis]
MPVSDEAGYNTYAGEGGERSERTYNQCPACARLAIEGQTETKTGRVQHRRRQHETGTIGETTGALGHLRPVRIAVKHSEEADKRHRRRHASPQVEGNDAAENDDRQANAELDEWNGNAGQAKSATQNHDGYKACRDEPASPPAKLGGEQADHDHGKHMVEPAERMYETMGETLDMADTRVGAGKAGRQCEGGHDR